MLESLTYIPLFHDINPEQVKKLDPLFEHMKFGQNSIIFSQGQSATHLYILTKGSVTIGYKPYDGPAITITHLQAGDIFGWSAVVGSKEYTSSGSSTSQVEVVRVLATDLWEFVNKNPDTGAFLLNRIARGVSKRWENAQVQVQAILDKALSEANKV